MKLTRRDALALGLGATAASFLPSRAKAATAEEVIAAFTGGATPGEGGITFTAPEIAENGITVPIAVDAPGAVAIQIVATGNPTPQAVTFNFGPLTGSQNAAIRIRLTGTQDVLALARMPDGSFVQAKKTVKVTVGGRGG
jgi:sulfur-oxidizing protein SoxY